MNHGYSVSAFLSAAVAVLMPLWAVGGGEKGATSLDLVPYPQEVTLAGELKCRLGGLDDARIVAGRADSSAKLPPEGYLLQVETNRVVISAADDAGEFYARQTLKQLARKTADGVELPCCAIRDWPQFAWRGVLFDDCRHFFGKEAVKKTMDAMAAHKMNVFHWHLTDDQGWRLAIPKYPELVKYGAYRSKSPYPNGLGKKGLDETPYGPFYYTEDDVKEILAYAKARHIRVIPEIELPGHAVAAVAAYPKLCCRGKLKPREPWPKWGVSKDIFCAGNDDTIAFLEGVLDYVVTLFPDAVVHIGGDEAPKARWEKCKKCQARMKQVGAQDVHALQGWVTKHFTEYLSKKGRRAIGWDEIMEADIPTDTLVMWWRGNQGQLVERAVRDGHDVVACPSSHYYFDHRQLPPSEYEKRGYGHPTYRKDDLTLKRAYTFNPLARIPAECHSKVIGVQCNMWSEHIVTPSEHEWKMWPRAAAVAETAWSGPHTHSWEDFRRRILADISRMTEAGYNVCTELPPEDAAQ